MTLGSPSRTSLLAVLLAASLAAPALALAQVPGENVNMVTGTQWPGGDPFLQRQNEPSLAVSSANPQHLLAGANDYRSVDLPNPLDLSCLVPGATCTDAQKPKMPGDAWLGVFKSFNGGQTWQSVLLPGYPQDTSTAPFQGASSPLRTCGAGGPCTSAADPVIRAGTDGMLYYSGIAFKRGTNWGKVFLARFIDLNNKENGDPTKAQVDPRTGLQTIASPSDPIAYIDEVVIANGDGNTFLDKPWIAVDKPRLLSDTCTVSLPDPTRPGQTVSRSFRGGAMYAAYVSFPAGIYASDIMFTRSANCGKTWSNPIKLNDSTSMLNQGPSIAIDPVTGFIYVAWRRMQWPETAPTKQGDAIMVARSFRGFLFTKPRLVSSITPFEQKSTGSRFRTEAFPSIAVSVDKNGIAGFVHIAWAQRQGPLAESRVVVSTASVLPPPLNGLEASDSCTGWSAPAAVDDAPISDDVLKRAFTRGHQFMPSITFSQGKLMVIYYDTRYDHTSGVFTPVTPVTAQPDLLGRFYLEERVPLAPAGVEPEDPKTVFPPSSPANPSDLDDGGALPMQRVRRTVEMRVTSAGPGPTPIYSPSVELSKFRFGVRGDETPNFSVPAFAMGDPLTIDTVNRIPITDSTFLRVQQLDANPPNLPMFKNGTVPFMGDYIDVQGPAFVRKNGSWAFNTDPSPAPVFHAVWTSNQDVRAPPPDPANNNYQDWSKYTPPQLPGRTSTTSIFDPTSGTTTYCSPTTSPTGTGYEGTRNQNIYTSRITTGLHLSSPQNTKPLALNETRSFVVAAYNDTTKKTAFRFTFTGPTSGTCYVAPGVTPSTPCASFGADPVAVARVDVEVLPHSSVSRSLFVRSGTPAATYVVNVNEVTVSGNCTLVAGNCPLTAGGLSGFVTLNPPGSNPTLAAPDGSTVGAGTSEMIKFASIGTASIGTASIGTASIGTASIGTASIGTSGVCAASIGTASIGTASIGTAAYCSASIGTASIGTASIGTAGIGTASIGTASIGTASIGTANEASASIGTAGMGAASIGTNSLGAASIGTASIGTASISDLSYQVTNDSNTNASYGVQFVCVDPDPANCPANVGLLQLMIHKYYMVPASVNCQLVSVPRPVLVANAGYVQDTFVPSSNKVDPNTARSAMSNATLTLAPGEKAQVTLRGNLSAADMATKVAAKVFPVVVPHKTPVGGPDGTWKYNSPSIAGIPSVGTSTTLTRGTGTFTATVAIVPTTANPTPPVSPLPSGTVTFILNGTTVLAIGALDASGQVVLTTTIPSGSSLVAYYGGNSQFLPSTSAPITTAIRATTTGVWADFTPPSEVGQNVNLTVDLSVQNISYSDWSSVGNPTGTLELLDGATLLETAGVDACFYDGEMSQVDCQVTFPVSTLTQGSHTLTARYGGDSNYAPSTSDPFTWAVVPLAVTVAVSPNPAAFTDAVTAFVSFNAAISRPMPTGTVTFGDQPQTTTPGATGFGSVTVPVNCYQYQQAIPSYWRCQTVVTLPAWNIAGVHTLIGSYSGDSNFSGGIGTASITVTNPVPVVTFTGSTVRPPGSSPQGSDYYLQVTNWSQYPDEAFAHPGTVTCGSNTNAARTWIDIFDGTSGSRIYGYCAFGAQTDLQRFSFFQSALSIPPASVKVRLIDMVTGVVLESAAVAVH